MEWLENKILLEKYFEGTSTLEEERLLKDFLKSYNGNDSEFLEAKMVFEFSSLAKADAVEIDFDDLVSKSSKLKIKKLLAASTAIAASLIVGLLLTFLFTNKPEKVVYAYVNGQAITNKAEAIMISKKALNTMSTNLNKGTQNLSYMKQLNKPAALITAQ